MNQQIMFFHKNLNTFHLLIWVKGFDFYPLSKVVDSKQQEPSLLACKWKGAHYVQFLMGKGLSGSDGLVGHKVEMIFKVISLTLVIFFYVFCRISLHIRLIIFVGGRTISQGSSPIVVSIVALIYLSKTYFASLVDKHHRSGPIVDHLYSIPLMKAYQVAHILNQCTYLLFSGSFPFSKYSKMGFLRLSSKFYRFRH